MSEAPPSTATSMRRSPTATRRSRRRSLEWAPATRASLACIASLLHMSGQEVEELLGGELGRVVALALKERSRKGVFPGELGEGQVVGVRDDRGDRAIEPEQEVVGPALNRAEDLVEVPAGPPDPNGFDLVKIHGLRARPHVRPRLRPQVHPRIPAVALRYLSGPLQLPSLCGIGADAATKDSPISPRGRRSRPDWLPGLPGVLSPPQTPPPHE